MLFEVDFCYNFALSKEQKEVYKKNKKEIKVLADGVAQIVKMMGNRTPLPTIRNAIRSAVDSGELDVTDLNTIIKTKNIPKEVYEAIQKRIRMILTGVALSTVGGGVMFGI